MNKKYSKKKFIFPCKSVDYFVSLQNKGYKSYLISTIVDKGSLRIEMSQAISLI